MVELKPKSEGPDDKPSAPAPAQAKPATIEVARVPSETASLEDGIVVKHEGDFTEIRLSRYLAEHIGNFHRVSHIVIRFKHGQAPDITAISG